MTLWGHLIRAFVTFVAFGLCAFSASAQEDAKVLPNGFSRVKAVGVFTLPITRLFDNNSQAALPAAALNQTVKMSDLAAKDTGANALYGALNAVQPGLGDTLYKADLIADVQITQSRYIVAAEHGFTPKLSVGVIVPVVTYQVDASFKADITNQADALLADPSVNSQPAIVAGLNQFKASAPSQTTYEQLIFTSKGYKTPSAMSVTGLGNVELGGKYQYFKNDLLQAAFVGGLRVPTTTHYADQSNLFDQDLGSHAYDVGLRLQQDLQPANWITIGSAAKFNIPLPYHQNRAFIHPGETLPDLTKTDSFDTVEVVKGPTLDSEISASFHLMDGAIDPSVIYGYSLSAKNSIRGGRTDLDYRAAEANTQSSAHTLELGLNYSTIPAFRAKKFPIPGMGRIAYNNTFWGTNTPRVGYVRFDLTVYF